MGEDGALRIDGLTPDSPLAGFVEVEGRFVQFLSRVPNLGQKLGDIRIDGKRTIQGQVNDIEKRPVAHARVILQPRLMAEENRRTLYGTPVLSRITYTDRGGRFRFDGVLGGELTLGINADGNGFHGMRLSAKAGSDPIVVMLEKGCVVTGQVLTEAGKPAAGASIQYLMNGTWGEESARFKTCNLRTLADQNGRFQFRGVPQHSTFTCFAMYLDTGKGYWSRLAGTYAADATLKHALTVHLGRYPR